MNVADRFRLIVEFVSKPFFGIFLALVFGCMAIYYENFKDENPDVNFAIRSDTSVLDIREELGELDVIYQGESLSKNDKDLRLIIFDVINNGAGAVLPNFFDPNQPWGVKVENGIIADEPSIVEASNQYLAENAKIDREEGARAVFSITILEPGQYFRVKLLILHDKEVKPEIFALGKIAGVSKIETTFSPRDGASSSLINIVFGGGAQANIFRLFFYGITFLLLLIGVVVSITGIENWRDKRKKEKYVKAFKDFDEEKISKRDSFFFDNYVSRGSGYIESLKIIANHDDILNRIDKGKRHLFVDEMIQERLANEHDGHVVMDEDRLSILNEFAAFLERKGALNEGRFTVSDDTGKQIPLDPEVAVVGLRGATYEKDRNK